MWPKTAVTDPPWREEEILKYFLYDDLWVVLSGEHQAYQKELSDLYGKRTLSAQDATRLDKKGLQPPDGQPLMKDWVAGLTEKVIPGRPDQRTGFRPNQAS